MADARRARAERLVARVAQTVPAGPACTRRSPSPVLNAATGPDAQEQEGSSQPATEHRDGRTATPSLVRGSGATSHARPEMPHGRCTLAMATDLLRYRPTSDHHYDCLHRIEELVAAAGDSMALSCSFRPNLPKQTTKNKMHRPHHRGETCSPRRDRKRVPAANLTRPGQS
ncbi:hypothetical protein D1007_50335 [Hordeum vulgare]|nr:hypothetical protein D1007_50335 [Hordeum vulgare]